MVIDQTQKCARKLCQSRSLETKEALIEAATVLFAEQGFHKVNTKDIAKAAGVAIGSFYGYFPDKKQLFIEIIKTYKESLLHAGMCQNTGTACEYGFDQVMNYFINQKLQVAERYPLAFHLEVNHMRYRDPDIAEVLEAFTQREMQAFIHHMESHRELLRVTDLNMAAQLIYQVNDNMIMAYLSSENPDNQELLINEYKIMIARYLFKDTVL